ncbi:hypothetical protein SAMN05421774_10848 [Gemmobacter megaterium]|uniref:ANTAR domain-containing protein n=1 Tax=Gemmobacter megaterium TaxID=1086013 RepID=A0A1N7QAM2_9RHOB|nr:hypothetical protein [Gemmobacter megaterium]GGE24424.1 hypothetical protein GCM10011345_32990 [Gemmobacter megaterium]SIT19891.1 hypothetical protein SAMN05421774_10848 [Gemmobacter megaterium]
MAKEEELIRLERELVDTRNAAVAMILGMAEGIVSSPAGREELASGFEAAAKDADQVTKRLATLVSLALRNGGRC